MTIPTATWRIQFRNGMTFDRAAGLVPYLKKLGISHLYASPVFTATSGSTHGYDVTDVNQIDPAIGGRAGFDRMVKALKNAGLGLILDIVPNHMAASLENAWWHDVVENGEQSRYARHFDIDWSRRLTLPFLGDTFETLLDNGEITLRSDPDTGRPAMVCHDTFYPLTPESWQVRETDVLQIADKAEIARLHSRQPWRLMCWRDAPHDLSYRRFFEVTGLVGMRVEDPAVFDDTHRLILELVHSGAVDGLRVDHIDGLADPKAYLDRLRHQAGPDCYITVEKILGEGEHLPADWPISGTTGYEFMSSLADALVDGRQISTLRKVWEQVVGKPVDMKAELRAAKLLMVGHNFEGEFNTLLKLALQIAREDNVQLDENLIRPALRELLVAFPVYRTYGTPQGLPAADAELLQKVATKVSVPSPDALAYILQILEGAVSAVALAATFRTRFQQLTGPLMAKSVEDTLFYRQNMALALNEVGAEPVPLTFSIDRFHAEMKTRLERQPDALSGTSTHDTKRGEDARARLYTLTEAPERWATCIARWGEMNKNSVSVLDDGPAPKPAGEWMLYQSLAGVWPTTLQPDDRAGLRALEERFVVYVEKSLREAKLRTNWADTNDPYEQAVLGYARHMLSPENQLFLQDFHAAIQPLLHAGLVNSLTQTLVKLSAPGVPDIYQGSEALDFSLVDPDNRREPDFATLARQLNDQTRPDFALDADWLCGRLNQYAIAKLLECRQQQPMLFRRGAYLPLTASGKQAENVLAFARQQDDVALIVIAPRLVLRMLSASRSFALHWAETEVRLPARLTNRRYRNLLTGEEAELTDSVDLARFTGQAAIVLLSE